MVLYRKYRPQNFDELVGQDHVTTTLKNALRRNRVAHAYLFAGPRGTGKTSAARILAAELGVRELDLIEVDAASHRGIDDIRDLREQVNFMPAQSLKKVYILDEAHMLTTEAFNALLKTLEEPPAHVHFVLCTTEPHKLPLTIVSRCQRFDFNLADETTLLSYVTSIAAKEGIKAESKVYQVVAKLAQGSFRDALSFLQSLKEQADQDEQLTLEKVQKTLGLVTEKEAKELADLMQNKEVKTALVKVEELAERGINFHYLLSGMIACLREQLVAVGRNLVPSDNNAGVGGLLNLIRLLHRAAAEIQTSALPQLPLEMAVVEYGLAASSRLKTPGSRQVESQTNLSPSTLHPSPSNLKDFWPKVLELVKPHNHSVEALLKGCRPVSFSDNILTLSFSYRFHKERISEARNRQLVEEVASKVLGQKVQIRCELSKKKEPAVGQQQRSSTPPDYSRPDPEELLKMAQETLGGEIIE